jgi:osmoprotectant transport system substrate-binding protein
VEVVDLSAVLLVGGSSRIPLVGQLVGAELDRPIAVDARPKDVISMGAALFAADTPLPPPGAVEGEVPDWASPPTEPSLPDSPAGGSDPGGDGGANRRPARIAVGVVAVVAVLATAFVLRGKGDEKGDRVGSQASERPTEGYDPRTDGPVADNFDLDGTALDLAWRNDTEGALLGEMSTALLEAAGAEVSGRSIPTNSDALHDGLVAGDIDLGWDGLRQVWRTSLGETGPASADPVELHEAVSAAEAEAPDNHEVVWLDPAAYDPGYTLVVSPENAATSSVRTISDLAGLLDGDGGTATGDVSVCSVLDPTELIDRVEEGYGLELPDWQSTDASELLPQLADGRCTVAIAAPVEGAIDRLDLVPLEDDRGVLGAANPAVGVRSRLLDDLPELRDLFGPVASRLDDSTVRAMMARVGADGEAPATVAQQWLAEQGFIPRPAPTGPPLSEQFDLGGTTFRLGSVETDEQMLLGEITRLSLEATGATVETSSYPPGTTEARDALLAGEIDLYWDHLARVWSLYLDHVHTKRDRQVLYDGIVPADAANGVTWLPPAAFDPGWVVATTRERAAETGVRSIADLEGLPAPGGGDSLVCSEISEALRTWIDDRYGFAPAAFEVVEDDIEGLIDSGDCRFGMVRAATPWFAGLDLVELADPAHAITADGASLAVRTEVADQHPQLAELVERLGDALTQDTVRSLQARVVVDGEDTTDVARSWLQDTGFVP